MKIISNFIFIFCLLISINAVIDYLPSLNKWLSRIHIGRFHDDSEWIKCVSVKSKKWMKNIPKVRVNDNDHFIIYQMLKGNFYSNSVQYWQKAALLLGLEAKENEKIIIRFLNDNYNFDGQWKMLPTTIDSSILSYALMSIKNKNIDIEKFKSSFDYSWELIKKNIGYDGTVMYRNNMQDYRYIDTIGMICPFLIKYGVKYNKNECIELAMKQIRNYKDKAFDDKNVPYHAFNIVEEYRAGVGGWSRGIGWFFIGIIDSWIELGDNYKYKKELADIAVELSKMVIEKQCINGGFSWNLLSDKTTMDSSATSIFAYCLKCASSINEIHDICEKSSRKALKYLKSVTRRNGVIDFSQGDTKGIGIYSMDFDKMPFTQGMTLRAISLYKKENIYEQGI